MKYLAYFLVLILISCSRDGGDISNEETISQVLKSHYSTERFRVLEVNPNIASGDFVWKINGEVYSNERILEFISNETKTYTLTLEIEQNGEITTQQSIIEVKKEANAYHNFISKVLEYSPAVGQFVNKLPIYQEGDTAEQMRKKAEESLSKGEMITLGGFGGYVVFGFDHTIPNFDGADFKIFGNPFSESREPGVIMVAYDKNKNGKPDPNEWYEIAGSEYHKASTIKNYSITYHKPSENNPDNQYIKWEDNQGNTGYKVKNNYHRQSYYPLWETESKKTFTGTKLQDNFTYNGRIWTGRAPAFGYADVNPNGDDIDISWAVDTNGNPVKLIGVDFIKVYTAINQEAGWLGEISTEIKKAENLWYK